MKKTEKSQASDLFQTRKKLNWPKIIPHSSAAQVPHPFDMSLFLSSYYFCFNVAACYPAAFFSILSSRAINGWTIMIHRTVHKLCFTFLPLFRLLHTCFKRYILCIWRAFLILDKGKPASQGGRNCIHELHTKKPEQTTSKLHICHRNAAHGPHSHYQPAVSYVNLPPQPRNDARPRQRRRPAKMVEKREKQTLRFLQRSPPAHWYR